MEMVEIVAIRNFVSNRVGSVTRKQRLRVPKPTADELIRLGLAQTNPHQTVCRIVQPLTEPPVGGGGELFALSPAVHRLQKPIATLLQAQGGSVLPSTTVGSVHLSPTSSMPATEHGGKSTTLKLKKTLPGKNGRKTLKPNNGLDLTELAAKTFRVLDAAE